MISALYSKLNKFDKIGFLNV